MKPRRSGVSHALVEPGTVLSCTLHGIRLLELRLPAFKPTLRGVGGGGVGGLNAHNKDLARPIQGSTVPYPPPPYPSKGPYDVSTERAHEAPPPPPFCSVGFPAPAASAEFGRERPVAGEPGFIGSE